MQKARGLDFLPGPEEEQGSYEAKERLYELAIIGGGPAGMTAAVYTARKRIDALLVSKDLGGQVLLTSDIENYMGYHYITGQELIEKFEDQMRHFPIAIALGETVMGLSKEDEAFSIRTESGKRFSASALLICSGKRSRELGVPGERELVGRGVTYCATCDAPLFAGMDVVVVGGGNSAFTAVVDLIKVARSVHVVNVMPDWQADRVLVDKVAGSEKVIPLLGHAVKAIKGAERVEGIVVEKVGGSGQREIKLGGVFVEIGLVPNSGFMRGVVRLNQWDEIVVDSNCRTSEPAIFAAGDVTDVPEKQIIIAAGDGAKAALSAYHYLLEVKPSIKAEERGAVAY